MTVKIEKPYTSLAKIYSYLMRSVDYKNWAKYLIDLFESFGFEQPRILELASGTGKVSRFLEKKFNNIIYSDISLEMLKNFETPERMLVCCDMTMLPFRTKFDIVFSIFDSVNYLTNTTQLKRMFNQVNKVLSDYGYFTFDVSLENNSKRYQKYLNRKGKFNGIHYKQISKYKEQTRIHYNIFELTFENGLTVQEIHKEKIYPLKVYYKLAETEGLYVTACYDAFSFNHGNDNSERVQLVLKKKDF
ncbi:class I SAM-dependent methyltransferase [Melioribacteraceae bacterium 4301-Me]|uniref:class I SAM-dependent DNA methyltransferase n=1 Tax=Pyranulibacter aquaticus TaxID=3163344 RepID=UPI00359B0534